MRWRWLLLGLLLCCTFLPLQAQDVPVRYAYYHNGYAYVSTERETVPGTDFTVRLEKITLPGGSIAYRMELRFPGALQFMKGTSFSAMTTAGRVVRAEQLSADKKNLAQYLFEEEDIRRLASGVTALEAAYNWTPDGFLSYSFKENEFGSVLTRELATLRRTPTPAVEIGDRVARYAPQATSTIIEARADTFPSASCQLRYIWYPSSGKEDFDLTFRLNGDCAADVILYDAPVVFTLSDGTSVTLPQRQAARGTLILYPTADELRALLRRDIRSVGYTSEAGVSRSLSFEGLTPALSLQYNALLMVAPN